jgi:hypothetical protein
MLSLKSGFRQYFSGPISPSTGYKRPCSSTTTRQVGNNGFYWTTLERSHLLLCPTRPLRKIRCPPKPPHRTDRIVWAAARAIRRRDVTVDGSGGAAGAQGGRKRGGDGAPEGRGRGGGNGRRCTTLWWTTGRDMRCQEVRGWSCGSPAARRTRRLDLRGALL